MHVSRALRQIANQQGGYFTARQAADCGYARYLLSYHSKNGNWLRIDRGLYRLPGYPDTPESSFARWHLWAGGKNRGGLAAISHDSALHYYGLTPLLPQEVHLTLSAAAAGCAADGAVIHHAPLTRLECLSKPGFLLTDPFRTLSDLKPDLLYRCQWVATVRMARETGLLGEGECRELLGDFREEIPAAGGRLAQAGRSEAGGTEREGRTGGLLVRKMREYADAGGAAGTYRAGRSFTLVEMLVVVAIMAVLAGLLMPALRQALDTARQVSCLNNLKQCGYGQLMYADENAGLLFSNRYWEANMTLPNRYWTDVFMDAGYLPDVRIWKNPGVHISGVKSQPVFQCGELPPPGAAYTKAGINFAAGENNTGFSYGVRDSNARQAGEAAGAGGWCLRLSTLNKQIPFLGDSYASMYSGAQGPWLGFLFSSSGFPFDSWGVIHRRHADRANLWFVDGSARSLGWGEIEKLPSPSAQAIQSYPKLY